MDRAASRLQVLAQQQLAACEADVNHQLLMNPTAAADDGTSRMDAVMEQGEPYAVPLPEKLYPDQPWQVFRCAQPHLLPYQRLTLIGEHAGSCVKLLQEHIVCAQAAVQL